ncbi:MAG: hypothetical protein COA91_05095 [Robiginitomaculum sp.]|nr:MAG: hypothetical protein COA91_05095 [Robiginitomaculum sp.]
MLLSRTEFDKKLSKGDLRIALIGMSNIGKSHTARRIAEAYGFDHYDVDAHIQAKMGNPSMQAMAKWMGQPYDQGYRERAATYLEMETEITLNAQGQRGNQVLDTTGSVIHGGANVIKIIKNNYLIIYIQANSDDIDVLTNRYLEYPKPTIWAQNYRPVSGLDPQQAALSRYPDMLASRALLYEEMADISLPAEMLSAPDLNDSAILGAFRANLP